MARGLEQISSRELSEWEAYERVCGPIGPSRDDLLNSRLLCMMANLVRPAGQLPYPLDDFMPEWDNLTPQQGLLGGDGEQEEAEYTGPKHQAVEMFEAMFEAYASASSATDN